MLRIAILAAALLWPGASSAAPALDASGGVVLKQSVAPSAAEVTRRASRIAQIPGIFNPVLTGPSCTPIGTPTSLGGAPSTGVGATTLTWTTTAPVPGGSFAYVQFWSDAGTVLGAITSVTIGSQSLSSQTSLKVTGGSSYRSEIWYCENCAAQASGVTATINHPISTGAGSIRLGLGGTAAGVKASSSFDQANSSFASGTTTPTVTLSGSLAQANELLVGYAGSDKATTPASFTEDTGHGFATVTNQTQTGDALYSSWKKTTVTTAPTYSPVWGSNVDTTLILGAFKGDCGP